jgi:Spy/CpxP family protein refolding chaperone
MRNPPRLRLALAALLLTAAPVLAQRPSNAPVLSGPPFAWWRTDPFRQELGLTSDQSARIDRIWETTRPELRQEWEELSRLEDKLSSLIQGDADETVLSRQIDRVETARANANKTRALMLVQMLKVLTPDQRTRFVTLQARWREESPRRDGNGSRRSPDARRGSDPQRGHDAPRPPDANRNPGR